MELDKEIKKEEEIFNYEFLSPMIHRIVEILEGKGLIPKEKSNNDI